MSLEYEAFSFTFPYPEPNGAALPSSGSSVSLTAGLRILNISSFSSTWEGINWVNASLFPANNALRALVPLIPALEVVITLTSTLLYLSSFLSIAAVR